MREIARAAQGHFPTQPRIVKSIGNLFRLPGNSLVTVLDAGCGTGQAIHELRDEWFAGQRGSAAMVRLYGLESDRGRWEQASKLLAQGPGGGKALWAAIEDAAASEPGASMLFFNPPYDRIRGMGRQEKMLFERVKNWCARGGHLVLIVPDKVLADTASGLAVAVERDYSVLAVFRYPEPEYRQFKQCVLVAQRRERALARERVAFPAWAREPSSWSILPDACPGSPWPIQLRPAPSDLRLRRTTLGADVLQDTLKRSPLRSAMLHEVLADSPAVERPLLPLKEGHLALALAGGLCDGIIERDGERFLVKGTLDRQTRRVAQRPKYDTHGEVSHIVDVWRTIYSMNVRCLRDDGRIEDYGSHTEDEVPPPDALEEET